ncbi:MAG: HPP family protein [Planctomycetaceae bacterium]
MNSAIERLLTLRVRDVMTPLPVHLHPDQTIDEATQVLQKNDISGAPVVDGDGVCVGVMSTADLAGGAYCTTVSELMSPSPIALAAETSMMDAARSMVEKHIHRVVVIDNEGHPTGVVTSLDVVASLVNVMNE